MNSTAINIDLDHIENILITTFSHLTGQKIDSQTTINLLRETGLDSLEMFEAFLEIEEHLNISISNDVMDDDDDTISQLACKIHQSTLQIDT